MMNSHGYATETIATIPKSMPIRTTVQKKQSHGRKKQSRSNKRSKKRIYSSSDEDFTDYSDGDIE